MKPIVMLITLISLKDAYSYAEKLSNIDKFKNAKQLEQVNVESGGLLILEQVQKEEKLNETFHITHECSKKKDKLKCRLVRIEAKTK